MTLPSNFWYQLGQDAPKWIEGFIFGAMAYAWGRIQQIRKSFGRQPHYSIELSHSEDIQLHIELDRVLHQLGENCMRVYFTKFHDGESYIDGSDMMKKSRTHERTRQSVSYQGGKFKNLLTSQVPEEMALVLEEGPSWRLIEDIPWGHFRWLMRHKEPQDGQAKAVARCAVFKRGIKHPIGFIGADFDGDGGEPANLDILCGLARDFGERMSANTNVHGTHA